MTESSGVSSQGPGGVESAVEHLRNERQLAQNLARHLEAHGAILLAGEVWALDRRLEAAIAECLKGNVGQ